MNVLAEEMRYPHAARSRLNALVNLFGRHAAALERKSNLVAHVERKKLLFRILKKRADVFRELRHGRRRSVEAFDHHPPFEAAAENLRREAVHEPHERRLPAAGSPRDKLELARVDREVQVPHGGSPRIGVGVGNVLKFNSMHVGPRLRAS